MADPKYANLRGIAYDQPDCYETTDLPEADQNRDEIEEESEFIEKININVSDSFSKFKGKTLIADGVDFSDTLRKTRTIGYYARSCDWELAASGDRETPMQRYERLKLEFNQLVQDLSNIKEGADEQKAIVPHVSTMLNQLENLKLDQLPEAQSLDLSDPQGIYLRKLLSELEKEKSNASEDKKSEKPGEGRVTYSVLARPDHTSANIASRIARLEQQINNIQSIFSNSDAKTNQILGESSLLDLAREVESQVTLLLPTRLEAADARISNLLTKMDQVQEKMPPQAAEADSAKVNELYDLLNNKGEMSDVLPRVIDRLVTLESLHKQVTDFSKSKTDYDTQQTSLQNDFELTKKLLEKMESNLDNTMTTLKSTVDQLNNKMQLLSELSSKKKGKK